jgi:hypothetical protein
VVLLFLVLASPASVLAAKKMLIQAQAAFNATPTDHGVSVIITGRVFEANNASVINAKISIQVNNPLGSSIYVSVRFTDPQGVFQDSFVIAPDSPAGNYTAYFVADRPGYDAARETLNFTYSKPDFSVEPSATTLSLRQGETGSLSVTVLSLQDFNKPVNLTAIDLPAGVTFQFNPPSIIPSGTATLNMIVSGSVPSGNYTINLLAVSGSLSHKASFQLSVIPAPFKPDFMLLTWAIVAVVIVLVAVAVILRSRARRRRGEAALEELIKQAAADTGYVATARVIARLEELRAMGKVDEGTYQRLKKDYEKRLEKSK